MPTEKAQWRKACWEDIVQPQAGQKEVKPAPVRVPPSPPSPTWPINLSRPFFCHFPIRLFVRRQHKGLATRTWAVTVGVSGVVTSITYFPPFCCLTDTFIANPDTATSIINPNYKPARFQQILWNTNKPEKYCLKLSFLALGRPHCQNLAGVAGQMNWQSLEDAIVLLLGCISRISVLKIGLTLES